MKTFFSSARTLQVGCGRACDDAKFAARAGKEGEDEGEEEDEEEEEETNYWK